MPGPHGPGACVSNIMGFVSMSQEKTGLQGDELAAAAPGGENQASEATGAPASAPQGDNGPFGEDEQPDARTETPVQDREAETDAEDTTALREALQQAVDEADRYRDQALRAAAETENVRKRAQRDVESARKYALEKFATELLGVRDSLEMGLNASEAAQADIGKLTEGMELTSRMLASAMEKFGVEVINPEGEAFDPELHEAVSTHETDSQAPNTVVSVVQKGYTLNGRVLRAAMVVVAKQAGGDA